MKKFKLSLITALVASLVISQPVLASQPDLSSQYNMSLEDKTTVGHNGAIAHPYAAHLDETIDVTVKSVQEITEGVYRLGGWGIANTIAIKAADGWIIVDAGDSLESASDQRKMLEEKVGKINVAAVLYTHSHYVHGAKAFQDKDTVFYGHEDLEKALRGDMGVSVLAGNFNRRLVQQFGMLHPETGEDAFPNALGFGFDKLMGTKTFVSPSITFEDNKVEKHTIAGITVEVLPSKTDVSDSVAFYFPSKKTLVSNALGSDMIFNLYTLRGDWYRDPMAFVNAADLALERDIEYQIDIHGNVQAGKENVTKSLQLARDYMQFIHDQTYRAISLGKDAQEAAEWVYMPNREGQETYGQLESHVKRVYGARLGWMGNDPYQINPLSKQSFSTHMIEGMGGVKQVIKAIENANAKQTLEGWQWALYLTSEVLILEPENKEVKLLRAEASRALGQRTTSANARGFYITEALLHEGKLTMGPQQITELVQLNEIFGAITTEKLDASPLADNIQFIRYMVDSRKAEGKTAMFNVNFTEEGKSYAIALRNGVIAITSTPNQGVTVKLTKSDWSQLLLGEKSFASLDKSLKAFDSVIK